MQIAKLILLLALSLFVVTGCRTETRKARSRRLKEAQAVQSGTAPVETKTIHQAAVPQTNAGPDRPAPTQAEPSRPSSPAPQGTSAPAVGEIAPRTGDEIVVAGQFVHTGTPVVLWLDPGGYDGYRVERRFAPLDESSWQATEESGAGFDSPNRYDTRTGRLTSAERERTRGGGWDLPTLQRCVDQIVLHYDVAGTSRQCFKVLHDVRDLSVQFMLDLDGTIYQTLDVKERARQASGVNDHSIGVEIANIGAYPTNATATLDEWYQRDTNGQVRVTLPARFGDGGIRTANFIARPASNVAVTNVVQGERLVQYDYTPEQYRALSHLIATLCQVLPEIKCAAPRDAAGHVPGGKLPDEELAAYRGVLGHYHITTRKLDPGPALQWDKLIGNARKLMNEGGASSNKPTVLR
jgi:N-acetylmuramoyl-L-alanine amidase